MKSSSVKCRSVYQARRESIAALHGSREACMREVAGKNVGVVWHQWRKNMAMKEMARRRALMRMALRHHRFIHSLASAIGIVSMLDAACRK